MTPRLAAWPALLALACPAAAGEAPSLTLEIPVELQLDQEAAPPRTRDLYLTVEPSGSLGLAPGMGIEFGAVLEPLSGPGPGQRRAFADHGLYLETLALSLETGPLVLRAGKINPAFGFAWDLAPGVYGTALAEEYELTERLGASATLALDDATALTAAGFTADRSPLGGSLLTRRDRLRRSDGGAGNAGAFSSWSLSLDGSLAAAPEMRYTAGVRYLPAGRGGGRDEVGAVAGLAAEFQAGAFTLRPLAEVAVLGDAGGERGDVVQPTLALEAASGPWFLVASHAGRHGAADSDATLSQVGAGYRWEDGPVLDLAYARSRDAGDTSHLVGFRLSFDL
ncbi:MAG TPA: hypothetical protein VEB20_14160 [Azospirillaceae bacterium]|nr:hypothetical protein [Azospirillaceae bacterium]